MECCIAVHLSGRISSRPHKKVYSSCRTNASRCSRASGRSERPKPIRMALYPDPHEETAWSRHDLPPGSHQTQIHCDYGTLSVRQPVAWCGLECGFYHNNTLHESQGGRLSTTRACLGRVRISCTGWSESIARYVTCRPNAQNQLHKKPTKAFQLCTEFRRRFVSPEFCCSAFFIY